LPQAKEKSLKLPEKPKAKTSVDKAAKKSSKAEAKKTDKPKKTKK